MTLDGSRSRGASIFCPDCFFFSSSFSASSYVSGLDLIAALGVDLLVFDPVTAVLVDLMKADLFALARGWKQSDRTRDQ